MNQSSFRVCSKIYDDFNIELNYPGTHNIYNALAATTISLELNVPIDNIKKSLKKYSGVKRRFEIKYNNQNNNIIVIDDYAHHPIEIEFTLNAIKSGWKNRIISIYEPHLYSRTKEFKKETAKALSLSDNIIISDIYGSREEPIENITSNLIIDELNILNHKKHIYIKDKNNIPHYLEEDIKENDIILIMGAGQINSITDNIIKIIKNKYE